MQPNMAIKLFKEEDILILMLNYKKISYFQGKPSIIIVLELTIRKETYNVT